MEFKYEGKRLVEIKKEYEDEITYYKYYYNLNGLRIKKEVITEYNDDREREVLVTQYYYEDNKLICEYRNNSLRIDYLYDVNDNLFGFIMNNNDRYYYIRDCMQNILGIIDNNGNIIVKYNYNAFGRIISITGSNTTIGSLNPFRYKGYYYDNDTSYYYCKSRYYNPLWCRWLTPDSVDYLDPNDINGLNLFSYGNNNPINNSYINNKLNYNSSFRIYTKSLNRLSVHLLYSYFDYAKNHRNPNRGTPNSIGRIFYPDGSPKQEREYGTDGRPVVDHDHHSGEDVGYDHDHDWDWEKNPPRQPAREPSKFLAALGLIGTGVALTWLIGNDATGCGAADDGLIPAVVTSFLAFWAIIFNEGEDNTW